MAHFALVVNNKVEKVLVVSNDDCGGGDFPESEPIGQAFLLSLGLTGLWLQCSYHANFRGNWPDASYTFNSDTQEFTPPPVPEPVEPTDKP
jgi:hypothetical protein